MADDEQPEQIWDEYDWERFLQQQDRKTEKYMELLEKYIDDPNRDQLIAQEMGWTHLLDETGSAWDDEEAEAAADDAFQYVESQEDEEEDGQEGEMHPLYSASFALTIWIDKVLDELGDRQTSPAAVKLATQAAVASAKLAAALSDDDIDEIGMTIAYLKRALRAITLAMEASIQLQREVPLDPEVYATLTNRLFQIRDGVISLMGEYRSEWRRRFGE